MKAHKPDLSFLEMLLDTFTPGLIQVVRKKTAGSHVALHGNFSGPVSATDAVKCSKDLASLVVCTPKKFFVWGVRFFVSDFVENF